ncbi:hypothetical protein HDV00_009367 [Rhizophlyctis rosea]|nr:hypothetical protein HDV00_009367 [Rhizophlyctis rosea]
MGPEVIFPTPQEIPVPNFRTPCGGEDGEFELFAPLVEGAFCQDAFDDLHVSTSTPDFASERVTEDFDFVSFLDSIEEPVRGLDASPDLFDVSPSFTNDSDVVTDDHVVDLGFDLDAAAPLFGDVGAAGDVFVDDGSMPLCGDLDSLSGFVAPPPPQQQNLVQEPTISIPISDLIRLLTAASAAQSPALTSLPSPAPSPALPPTTTIKKAPKAKAPKKPYDRPTAKKDEVQKTHRCPGEGCSKSFWRRDALRRHMEKNGCLGDLE